MNKMLNFDSFTLIPTYSDIESRSEVDVSTNICEIKSNLAIINANMLSISTKEMVNELYKYNTISSYHRFFNSMENRIKTMEELKDYKDKIFISIGTKKEEYDCVKILNEIGYKNIIVDVNHGHHKMVKDIIKHIKNNYPDMVVMAGNVSSVNGILFLQDAGVDIIKIGNSFGFSCTTIKQTGFGAHPIDTAIKYDKYINKKNKTQKAKLCIDGGIRNVSDIAKSLIFGDIVMLGRMFAGSNESFGKIIDSGNGMRAKEYFGNASVKTKQVMDEENHVKNIEGTTKLVPLTGPLNNTLKSIKEGLQSAFSFVGARNLKEYQEKAKNQILMV
jgi:IMP dehydrogenase/GMP reductase